jgi:ectoine hydroxylase-related dioxygenase (phytanoyl-CoA dioxygenase family)
MENFSPYHEGFAQLFHNSKLEGAISELFGEPAVLFKEKINFKLPGGDGFKPHQDHQAGWWEYNTLCITALICIDEANEENGCLEIAPGKHKGGMFKEWTPLSEAEMNEMKFISCPTQPGDMILFDSFTPHGSKPNLTDRQRRLLFVTYNRLSEGDSREQYYKDKRKSYPQDCEREKGKDYVFRV